MFGLSIAIPAPAADGLVDVECAGVEVAGGNRGVLANGGIGLSVAVIAPAVDGLVGTECAGV